MSITSLLTKKTMKRGFSLIENVLYVVLLSLVMSIIVGMLISLSGVYKNIKLTRELESSGSIVMETILREVRNASNVVVTGSNFGANPGILIIAGVDESAIPYEITFDLLVASSTVRMSKNGSTPVALSSRSATTSLLLFTRLINANSEGVRVELQMSGVSGSVYKNAKFYGFAVIRGSY